MLTHIVCWKYRSDVTGEMRSAHRDALRALPAVIKCIESFRVGADILDLDRSFDTGLVAVFAGRRELDEYTENAEHKRVAAMGRELSEQVVSVDFVDE